MSDIGSYSISGNSSRNSGSAAVRQAVPAANVQKTAALNGASGAAQGGMAGGGSSGSTLRGQVMSTEGRGVTLMLEDGSQVSARLENGMTLTPGQELAFLIRGRAGDSLMLAPLMENTSSDPTMLKALQQAGLPVNEKTLRLVGALMDAGENIAKPNLLRMSHLMNAHPSADPADLVSLKSLGLPVTGENLEQLSHYRNLEHELLASAEDIAEGIAGDLAKLLRSGDTDKAQALAKGLEQLFSEETGSAGELSGEQALSAPEEEALSAQKAAGEEGNIPAAGEKGQAAQGEKIVFSEEAQQELPVGKTGDGDAAAGGTAAADGKTDGTAAAGNELAVPGRVREDVTDDPSGKPAAAAQEEEPAIRRSLSGEENTHPSGSAAAKTPPTASELLGLAKSDPAGLAERLKNALRERFSVSPEEVDKENLEKLYTRLRNDTEKLSNLLNQAGREGGKGFEEIKGLRQNLDFMQDMNQIFGYIQLPLKLEGREASGDLYVFGRKGKKPQPGEPVSALLHLDMDHLGPLDVYVSMKDKEVSARFTLRDEDTVSFIAEHIDGLKERIVKRGYQISTSLGAAREDEPGLMEQMLSPGSGHAVISHQAFEARV